MAKKKTVVKGSVKPTLKPKAKPKGKPILKKPPTKKKSKFSSNKRGPAQIAKDRIEIMDYYLKGKNYRDIAKLISADRKYSISYTTIGNDVKFVLKEWKETREDKMELYITIELAKIDKLEVEYWEAWEKSKQDYDQVSGKIVKRGPKSTTMDYKEEVIKKFVEYGDPRYLQGIERCVQKRIDLLGLEAAKEFIFKDVSEITNFRVKQKQLDNVKMVAVK